MFSRRENPEPLTPSQQISSIREAGFAVSGGDESPAVTRDGIGAQIELGASIARITSTGLIIGDSPAQLISRGYQTVWRTDSGDERPARAAELKTYHAFLEDLREALGLTSLYHQSLGATHTSHQYDRLA